MMSKHIVYLYKRIDGVETVEIDSTERKNSPARTDEKSKIKTS